MEAVCDRVIIIINGEVKADARLSDLAATSDAILTLQEAADGVEQALQSLDGVSSVEQIVLADGYPSYRVAGQTGDNLCPAMYELARRENWAVRELRRETRTLETVFNELATATSPKTAEDELVEKEA